MSRTLALSLWEAWTNKATRARAILMAAHRAPALFKPDRIQQADADYRRAASQADQRRFW